MAVILNLEICPLRSARFQVQINVEESVKALCSLILQHPSYVKQGDNMKLAHRGKLLVDERASLKQAGVIRDDFLVAISTTSVQDRQHQMEIAGPRTATSIHPAVVRALQAVGFSKKAAEIALHSADGSFEHAVELLLDEASGHSKGSQPGRPLDSLPDDYMTIWSNMPLMPLLRDALHGDMTTLPALLERVRESHPEFLRTIVAQPLQTVDYLVGMRRSSACWAADGTATCGSGTKKRRTSSLQVIPVDDADKDQVVDDCPATISRPSSVADISLLEEEAVQRLCGLGVDRGVALNAYRRCNQSEEEAANWLVDSMASFSQ